MSKFEIYRGKYSGEECWCWRLIDSNGKKIAKGDEPFVKSSIKRSIKTIQSVVCNDTPVFQDESVEDKDKGYRFEYFQSLKDEQWYWRFKSGNNKVMATGGEGFSSKSSVKASIDNVKVEIPRADILFENLEDDPAHEAQCADTTSDNPQIPPGS